MRADRFVDRVAADVFGFGSGVVRNARTFHPDGRVFNGTARSLQPADARLARAAERLEGAVLLRIGMGLMKKGAPRWLADHIPDAPSIAARFSGPGAAGEALDLLCTAGGDRLWKLIVNLSTGGWMFGLHRFDYFQNVYYADVPYSVDDGQLDVWIRFTAGPDADRLTPGVPHNGTSRERGLTNAVAGHAHLRVEASAGDGFVPIAEIRFDEEIQVDQEALHFSPFEGRGFVPRGFLTRVRRSVYPASVACRAPDAPERAGREHEGIGSRLARYFKWLGRT